MKEIDKAERCISLPELAQRLNMSEDNFKRLFKNWVGTSPRGYQQYLNVKYPKQLLKYHHCVSKTAREGTLSNTGNLYNTVVTWTIFRPGDLDKKKKKIFIGYSWMESPFGEALIMATKQGICGVSFSSEIGKRKALADMMLRWPQAEFSEERDVDAKIDFPISRGTSKMKIHVIGAPFQIRVWAELMHIPSGNVSTYSDIAAAIGRPKATRAVGTAVGKNPISWLIPCHRALRKSGELGGYHWGLPLKRTMLAFESVHRDASQQIFS